MTTWNLGLVWRIVSGMAEKTPDPLYPAPENDPRQTRLLPGVRIGYARVSTADQRLDRQRAALEAAKVSRIFIDEMSGAARARPGLRDALGYAREGDTFVVTSLDRLARSTRDLLAIVDDLDGRGVTLEVLSPSLHIGGRDDPSARLMVTMLGAVAELEREMIRARQREGIDGARRRKVYAGRARALSPEQIEAARQRRAAGVPATRIAREMGVSERTVRDALAGKGAYGTVGEQ